MTAETPQEPNQLLSMGNEGSGEIPVAAGAEAAKRLIGEGLVGSSDVLSSNLQTTDAPETSDPADTPAKKLGLVGGKFNVRRTSGVVEDGWSIERVYDDEKSGKKTAKITKPYEPDPELHLEKDIPVDMLLDWQKTEAPGQETPDEQVGAEQRNLEEENQLLNQLKELEQRFSEEDGMNLWRYAAGLMNKREEQIRGYAEGAKAHEQSAGQAYRALSPEAREVASQYHGLMQQLDRVRRPEHYR